jgi:D-tyrosyl-tRNA(Tyr) deacylase
MRLVIQRVSEARVTVAGLIAGSIGRGLLVLVGVSRTDSAADADYLADKTLGLRIFPDDSGRVNSAKMNLNIAESGGSLLVVSQFTLYGSCVKGRRPSFDQAAPAELARDLYNYYVERLRQGPVPVETGVFQADMQVHLVNQGPVTILIDSTERSKK